MADSDGWNDPLDWQISGQFYFYCLAKRHASYIEQADVAEETVRNGNQGCEQKHSCDVEKTFAYARVCATERILFGKEDRDF